MHRTKITVCALGKLVYCLQTQAMHTHAPSASSLAMNPASRHGFTNPCSSSQRGQPRKGACLFVLRETWWKKLWFICPQDRIRKQMDKSYLFTGCDGVLAFLLAWSMPLCKYLYVDLNMWDAVSCHNRACQSHCRRWRGLSWSQRQCDILSRW